MKSAMITFPSKSVRSIVDLTAIPNEGVFAVSVFISTGKPNPATGKDMRENFLSKAFWKNAKINTNHTRPHDSASCAVVGVFPL